MSDASDLAASVLKIYRARSEPAKTLGVSQTSERHREMARILSKNVWSGARALDVTVREDGSGVVAEISVDGADLTYRLHFYVEADGDGRPEGRLGSTLDCADRWTYALGCVAGGLAVLRRVEELHLVHRLASHLLTLARAVHPPWALLVSLLAVETFVPQQMPTSSSPVAVVGVVPHKEEEEETEEEDEEKKKESASDSLRGHVRTFFCNALGESLEWCGKFKVAVRAYELGVRVARTSAPGVQLKHMLLNAAIACRRAGLFRRAEELHCERLHAFCTAPVEYETVKPLVNTYLHGPTPDVGLRLAHVVAGDAGLHADLLRAFATADGARAFLSGVAPLPAASHHRRPRRRAVTGFEGARRDFAKTNAEKHVLLMPTRFDAEEEERSIPDVESMPRNTAAVPSLRRAEAGVGGAPDETDPAARAAAQRRARRDAARAEAAAAVATTTKPAEEKTNKKEEEKKKKKKTPPPKNTNTTPSAAKEESRAAVLAHERSLAEREAARVAHEERNREMRRLGVAIGGAV